jgi:hypothetical protein
MHFLLKIDSHSAVGANDLVGTNSCVGAHIAARIRNANISGIVTHAVMGALVRGCDQFAQKFLV